MSRVEIQFLSINSLPIVRIFPYEVVLFRVHLGTMISCNEDSPPYKPCSLQIDGNRSHQNPARSLYLDVAVRDETCIFAARREYLDLGAIAVHPFEGTSRFSAAVLAGVTVAQAVVEAALAGLDANREAHES